MVQPLGIAQPWAGLCPQTKMRASEAPRPRGSTQFESGLLPREGMTLTHPLLPIPLSPTQDRMSKAWQGPELTGLLQRDGYFQRTLSGKN